VSYSSLINRLYRVNCDRGVKLGLQNSLKLHQLLGEPGHSYPVIHVAGTNGKGSVTTKVAAALQHGGYRVGLFTSPHLTSFRERFQVDGRPVTEEEVVGRLPWLLQQAEQNNIPATFFELTTHFAFDYFACREVDIAVVEVGLGGRLDATNIVDPLVSVITSIGLDHTEILGQTREAIAAEKGGIIKAGCPVVLGGQALGVGLERMALERGCQIYPVYGEWANYIQENNAIARRVLEVVAAHFPLSQASIEEGLAVQPPCRFERVGRAVLDVAHNPAGIRRLIATLDATITQRPRRCVIGLSSGKDHAAMLKELQGQFDSVHLVSTDHPRLAGIEEFRPLAAALGLPLEGPHGDCEIVVRYLIQEAKECNDLVVVCGSCFLMAAAQKALGRHLIVDSNELNETFRTSL
jgi:dihydrofolate synthase / folylpolyglutamate synthase